MSNPLKVALVHDFLNQWGGAEQVLACIAAMFPEAPIYTLFREDNLPLDQAYAGTMATLAARTIHVSSLQKYPRVLRQHRLLLPFYPTATEKLDLTPYDVVISDSGAWVKGVITRPDSVHINYCHSPTRFLWDWHERYLREQHVSGLKSLMVTPLMSLLRIWDRWAADRVDFYVANSVNVQRRIAKYYERPSTVIYPPVDVLAHEREIPHGKIKRTIKTIYDGQDNQDNYYLVVGRLSSYKKVDLAVEACNRLQLPLHIVGTDPKGKMIARLRKKSWGTVQVLPNLNRSDLQEQYRHAKALLMCGVEDFGMVMVEAMAFGKPVLAYHQGGALEIVESGKTGEFFEQESVRSLMDAIRLFESRWAQNHYQPREIFAAVKRFDSSRFKHEFMQFVRAKTQILGEQ